MSYKHKWVNDKSRAAVIYSCGRVVEYSCEPSAKVASRCEVGAKYIQRYTDQQMELETQGWTPWNAGDEKPNVDDHLMIDIFDNDDHETKTVCEEFGDFSWESNMNAIAYRLSNADGYKDGVRIEASNPISGGQNPCLPDSAKWKAGELPPANIKCEARRADGLWYPCDTIGEYQGSMVCATGWGFKNMDAEDLRPIQTDKERLIAAGIEALGFSHRTADVNKTLISSLEKLYDAGLLSMPDRGEE